MRTRGRSQLGLPGRCEWASTQTKTRGRKIFSHAPAPCLLTAAAATEWDKGGWLAGKFLAHFAGGNVQGVEWRPWAVVGEGPATARPDEGGGQQRMAFGRLGLATLRASYRGVPALASSVWNLLRPLPQRDTRLLICDPYCLLQVRNQLLVCRRGNASLHTEAP